MAKAVRFINWTSEDFTWKFNNEDYTFPAGESMLMEAEKAMHFAKHLAYRELNNANKRTNDPQLFPEYVKKCFTGEEYSADSTAKLSDSIMTEAGKEISDLKAKNQVLMAQLAEAEAKNTLPKPDDEGKMESEVAEDEKPKRVRTKKVTESDFAGLK
jgi:hypothetical protein